MDFSFSFAVCFTLHIVRISCTSYTWEGGGSNSWTDPKAWNPNTGFPHLPTDTASFSYSGKPNCTYPQQAKYWIESLQISAGGLRMENAAFLNVGMFSMTGGSLLLDLGSGGTGENQDSTLQANTTMSFSGGSLEWKSGLINCRSCMPVFGTHFNTHLVSPTMKNVLPGAYGANGAINFQGPVTGNPISLSTVIAKSPTTNPYSLMFSSSAPMLIPGGSKLVAKGGDLNFTMSNVQFGDGPPTTLDAGFSVSIPNAAVTFAGVTVTMTTPMVTMNKMNGAAAAQLIVHGDTAITSSAPLIFDGAIRLNGNLYISATLQVNTLQTTSGAIIFGSSTPTNVAHTIQELFMVSGGSVLGHLHQTMDMNISKAFHLWSDGGNITGFRITTPDFDVASYKASLNGVHLTITQPWKIRAHKCSTSNCTEYCDGFTNNKAECENDVSCYWWPDHYSPQRKPVKAHCAYKYGPVSPYAGRSTQLHLHMDNATTLLVASGEWQFDNVWVRMTGVRAKDADWPVGPNPQATAVLAPAKITAVGENGQYGLTTIAFENLFFWDNHTFCGDSSIPGTLSFDCAGHEPFENQSYRGVAELTNVTMIFQNAVTHLHYIRIRGGQATYTNSIVFTSGFEALDRGKSLKMHSNGATEWTIVCGPACVGLIAPDTPITMNVGEAPYVPKLPPLPPPVPFVSPSAPPVPSTPTSPPPVPCHHVYLDPTVADYVLSSAIPACIGMVLGGIIGAVFCYCKNQPTKERGRGRGAARGGRGGGRGARGGRSGGRSSSGGRGRGGGRSPPPKRGGRGGGRRGGRGGGTR